MEKFSKENIKKINESGWSFFVKHQRVTFLLILIIIIWGVSSLNKLPRELEPEVKLPYAAISTVYPGANPQDVEELITNKIEKAAKNVENVKEINSSSEFSISMVIVEFESGIDMDKAINDLKSAVDNVKNELPEEANDPNTKKFDINSQPIINFSLLANISDRELKLIAEDTADELEKITGVSKVVIIGSRAKQIVINLKQDQLEKYGISIDEVSSAISVSNLNFPIGQIENDEVNYSIRLEAELESASDLGQIPVKQFYEQDGISKVVLLADIAEIKEILEEKTTIARVGIPKENNIRNAVTLQVYKKEGGNIVKIAENAKKEIESLKGSIIPENVGVQISSDNAKFVQDDLNTLTSNGLQTIGLILLLLFIFLGLREAIIASLSIPIALLITFGFLNLLGQTLNSLTLFSLVFALGLMIDNAIIVIDGIYDYLKTKQFTTFGSAILAIHEFKWPIISGTLTTVVAFLPMLFISGIMGQYMAAIPIAVTVILLASLFVNLTITPSLAAKYLKQGNQRNLFKNIQKWYANFIEGVLNSKIKRIFYLSVMTIALIISFSLPILGILKVESFPASDFDYFYIDIETPPGTALAKTEAVTAEVEKILIGNKDVETFTTSIGSNAGTSMRQMISTQKDNSNIASITVNLVELNQRKQKSYEISDVIRQEVAKIQGGTVTVTDLQGGPPSGAPIEVKIIGPEMNKLEEITVDIEQILKNIPGTQDVKSSIQKGAGEFNITLDKKKLNFFGIAPIQVASLLRNSISGSTVSTLRQNGEEIDIIAQYKFTDNIETNNQISLDDINNLSIESPVAGLIPLNEVIEIDFQPNLTSISHLDTKKVLYITSYVKDRTTNEIIDDLKKELDKNPLPKDYTIDFGGELEEIEQSLNELGISLLIGVVLIFLLLILQFKSYIQPFIIILSLPFGLVGVFIGSTLIGLKLSIPSMIGIVGLAGVVVNDAIVLIDQINLNRKIGMQFKEAIKQGCVSRLQAVFLTSATSILGILPLALTNEIWGALGFAFVFGLTTQYFLVLLLDPILYSILCKKPIHDEPAIYIENRSDSTSTV